MSALWSTFLILVAALNASLSGLMMRRTLGKEGSSVNGYLTFYFLISCLFASLLNSILSTRQPLSLSMISLGGITGLLVVALMVTMGFALEKGPSGLTFAFQNSGSIVPPLLMALIFKGSFGFSLSLGNIGGMILVIAGLFWAARNGKSAERLSSNWIIYALLTFLCQATILTIFQWRCLLIESDLPSHPLIPFHCRPQEENWFMPAMFLSALLFQGFYFFFIERRIFTKQELIGGSLGGIANGLSTFFLLLAIRIATPVEKAMLFPLFAVLVILLCNIYGRAFYKETVNWKANACCILGIVVGTLF